MDRIKLRISDSQYAQAIDTINEYVKQLQNDNADLAQSLKEYSKDEEIQKLRQQIMELRRNSLLILSPKEKEGIKKFQTEHYKKCKNGYKHEFTLTGSGIGTSIEIKCPLCGEIKDVTDITSW